MARIYISSTYEDLKKEREAAAKAVRRLGHQPVYMEDYVAGPQRPVEKCLQDILSCDAYVGIFAWRYGFIPDGCDKSITHLEYEAANKVGVPCLIFLLDQKAPWPVEYVETGKERQKIDQLRNELRDKYIVSFFRNADELSSKVSAAVRNLNFKEKAKVKARENEFYWKKWGLMAAAIIVLVVLVIIWLQQRKPENVTAVEGIAKNVYKNDSGYWEADYGNGIIMVYIPPGEFTMGSNDGESDEHPPHPVYLDGYWIGKYEVTVRQFKKFITAEKRPLPDWVSTYSPKDNHPVVGVSWDDANAYCQWLSKKTGLKFKLPTEAQWEKAARGTDGRKYPWGKTLPPGNTANFADIKLSIKEKKYYTWADKNIDDGYAYTAPVGSYPQGASPYGLMDMAGNVREWCQDWYDKNYYQTSPGKNPTGPKNDASRVLRGGSWGSRAVYLRCSNRVSDDPSYRIGYVGFRLCQDEK
jgi:formylglycine-generating enzyme required for sulfatase activity